MTHLSAWAGALVLLATQAPAAEPIHLAAHHALYSLTLESARSSDILGANGTMGYEVQDACDGWAVRQRLDMHIANSDGQTIEMVSDYATWESKDGLRLRFHMRQTTDTAVTSQTDGDAKLQKAGGSGVAHYTTPKQADVSLPPGTLFPMAHTAALLAAAEAGQKYLNLPLFDGTDENGAEISSIAITSLMKPEQVKWTALSGLASTRVNIAFFGMDEKDMLPDYDVAMRYWMNGVADDLRMDFGDFVMKAKMTEFTPQPRRC